VGEITAVSATLVTFTRDRLGDPVEVDDAFTAAVDFESGAVGMLLASRVAPGRKNSLRWEINRSGVR